MTEIHVFSCLVAALFVFPAAAHRLALRGRRHALLAVLVNAATLLGYLVTTLRPELIAPLTAGTDLALLYPTWGGVPAIGMLVSLRAGARGRERRELLLLAACVLGYYGWDASRLMDDPGAYLDPATPRAAVCMQTTDWSCAPAAGVSLLRAYGVRTSEADMARAMKTRPFHGTTDLHAQRGLARMLAAVGRTAVLRELSYDQFAAEKSRALLPVRESMTRSHMLCVLEVVDDGVIVSDPQVGIGRLSRAEVEARWAGVAIMVE